ncbi:DUF6460 domain-containing protein [Hyphococcus sp. DH-69]|uniref:DUF6460 domain-containing protein n=1 Tax=Hyphococcus formosus TaxID=3143534 RepID=UPI00398AD79C
MADKNFLDRVKGGSGTKTFLQLVVVSIIVGAIFTVLGISPRDFWRGIFDNVQRLVAMLGENVGEVALTLFTYLIIGAAVVVPIWLITRLISRK